MANPEHVAIVKQGRDAIANWRIGHQKESMDLTHADLTELNLAHASLYRASMNGAKLLRANMRGTNLYHANLKVADVTSANLTEAVLSGANLYRANLTNVDMTYARTGHTLWADVDLSTVKGLETLWHMYPSTIGIDTLIKSKGKIPEVFLRGCGVPEEFIRYIPSLIGSMEPIQFYSCFISHSSKDDDFARRLHSRLQAEKLRVWFAPEDMKGGRKSLDQIDEAIRVYDRLLLVLSNDSMKSEWVQFEIKRAREKERISKREVLFPISLVPIHDIKQWKCHDPRTGEDLAEKIIEYHIPNFSNWKHEDAFEKAFADLMRDLRREDAARS